MIYMEKDKNEYPFVSINTVARGRILPKKQPDGIGETPLYPTKEQKNSPNALSVTLGARPVSCPAAGAVSAMEREQV